MSGWVKLHRRLLEWEWYRTENMVHLFTYLLLSANHETKRWMGIEVERGQLITGRKSISVSTGISEQSIRTCLDRLKSTKEVTIKSTNKYTIITICNYESYQCDENETNQHINQVTNQQLTNNQPATNHKQELKNIRTKEEDILIADWRKSLEVYLADCKKAYNLYYQDKKFISEQERLNPGIDVRLSIEKGYINFWGTEAGWKHKKKGKGDINWKLTFINAISMNKVYKPREENRNQPIKQLSI